MRGASAGVLLLLSACASAPAGPDAEAALAALEEGREAAARGEHGRAVERFSAAVLENPELAEAYFRRGVSRVQMRLDRATEGDVRTLEERAIEDFSAAIGRNPLYGDAYFNRAMVRASRGQYRLAAQDLLEAIKHRPQDPEPHLWIAKMYDEYFEDMQVSANEHYDKYADLGGRDPAARDRARAWKDLKRQAGAAPAAGKASSAEDEKKAEALHGEFKRLFAEGDRKKALQTVELLLRDYGHTVYVQSRTREFNALLNALRK